MPYSAGLHARKNSLHLTSLPADPVDCVGKLWKIPHSRPEITPAPDRLRRLRNRKPQDARYDRQKRQDDG